LFSYAIPHLLVFGMLREFTSREELKALLDKELEGDRREKPENNLLENTLQIALAGEFTTTKLEVYGYPERDPQYILFVESTNLQYPYIYVRKPLSGHNIELLNECARLLLTKYRSSIREHGKLLVVGDAEICEAFAQQLFVILGEKFETLEPCETGVFYMTAAQREAILSVDTDAPVGFTITPVDVDKDGETIHRLWKYGVNVDITKDRLRHLPSICARNEKGEVVGWAMSARFGQIANLYVLPEYRNNGLGKGIEVSLAKDYARRGLRVFKFVELSNKSVFDGSLRSPHWTLWMKEDEDNNDTKTPNLNYFRRFKQA
ncbi:hypothetical protein PFISCL1PPCAC_25932, partial [Pristionchus fissidentatus]